MGTVTILPETTRDPISLIGRRAGICWGANIDDPHKNYQRGIDCMQSMHGRTLEYVNVEFVLDGYSARVIREFYTHIGGAPSRLQASTRYIDYEHFGYVIPPSIDADPVQRGRFMYVMGVISNMLHTMQKDGVPREDLATMLPLAMKTRMVDRCNLRHLIDMSHQRMCTRANWEFRRLFHDLCNALSAYSEEWAFIIQTQMMPKCEYLGYCPERKSCGRKCTTRIEERKSLAMQEVVVIDHVVVGDSSEIISTGRRLLDRFRRHKKVRQITNGIGTLQHMPEPGTIVVFDKPSALDGVYEVVTDDPKVIGRTINIPNAKIGDAYIVNYLTKDVNARCVSVPPGSYSITVNEVPNE